MTFNTKAALVFFAVIMFIVLLVAGFVFWAQRFFGDAYGPPAFLIMATAVASILVGFEQGAKDKPQ